MKIYRTSWGSLKMKIVASSNLWVKRTLKLNTLRGRERRSDWFWQVYREWRTVYKSQQLPHDSSALFFRYIGLSGWCGRHQNCGAVQEEQRAVLWNRTREAEIQAKLQQNQRAWEGGTTHIPVYFRGDNCFIVVLFPPHSCKICCHFHQSSRRMTQRHKIRGHLMAVR